MNKEILLKRKNQPCIKAYFRKLNTEDLNKIMELQDFVLKSLEDKELYFPSEKEEFKEYIVKNGTIIGCITEEEELVAIGVYGSLGEDKKNYGYDLGYSGEDLFKVGQIESTIVKSEYRGNKLQRILCEILHEIGIEKNTPIMTATASPYNSFSVNTFLDLGYEIKKDKIKYGGLRRYVLEKKL